MNFREKVYEYCKLIPKGKVSTYKEIGNKINSKAYRAIGFMLSQNTNKNVPCHRVIQSNGCIGGFKGSKENSDKIKLLRDEGVVIINNKVNLKEFLYKI
tara:strand:- start:224 stop:520 length:297 start_codon:yes stop_codon:yes gene_type:complete